MNYLQLRDAIQNYTESSETSFVASIPRFVRQAEERIVRSVMIPELRKNATSTLVASNPYLQRPTDFLSVFSLAVIDGSGNYNYLIDKDVNFMREAYPSPSSTGVPKYYSQFDGDGVVSAQGNFILAPTPSDGFTVELHYYYDPPSIVQSSISVLGAIAGGSGYTPGRYWDVPLTGGSGSGATANITVSGAGVVSAVDLVSSGALYVAGNTLAANNATLGGGSLFSVPVNSVQNTSGTSWFGDNAETVLLYGCLIEAYTYLKGDADLMQMYTARYNEAMSNLFGIDIRSSRDDYRDGQYKVGSAA